MRRKSSRNYLKISQRISSLFLDENTSQNYLNLKRTILDVGVKGMNKTLLVVILVFLASVLTVAAGSKLEIGKVEITSDDDTLLSTSSSSGDFDVEPGQQLKVKVTLENNYAESTHNDMDDVSVSATIEGMDDDDTEDSADGLSVRADGHRTVTLRLDIPDDASSYESYYLIITATGEDENGTTHSDEASYDIEVDREEHELVFNELSMNDVECGEDGMLRIDIENTGEEDEEDAELEVWASGLGLVWSDEFDLSGTSGDDDSTYEKYKRIDLSGIQPGSHTLTVKVTYNDGDDTLEKTLDFHAEGCGSSAQHDYYYEEDVPEKEQAVEAYTNPNRDLRFLFSPEEQPVVVEIQPQAPRIPVQPQPAHKESAFSIIGLLLANLAIIVFIALLLSSVKGK
jgi:hypothetical protein